MGKLMRTSWIAHGLPMKRMGYPWSDHGPALSPHEPPIAIPQAFHGQPVGTTWVITTNECKNHGTHEHLVGSEQPMVAIYGQPVGLGYHDHLVDYHHQPIGQPWAFHGPPMGILWETHGRPHGMPMGTLWAITTNPRTSHGPPMGNPRKPLASHGQSIKNPLANVGLSPSTRGHPIGNPTASHRQPVDNPRWTRGRPMGNCWLSS